MVENESPNYKEMLNEVLCRVMEQTAFMFPEPADLSNGFNFDDIGLLLVNLSYTGDKEGRFSMIVPVDFCKVLSDNLLGEDMDGTSTKEEYSDAAKEILNIIAGQLLTRIYGEKAVFNLKSPEVKDISSEDIYPLIEDCIYSFYMADDLPIIATMVLTEKNHEHKSISG